MRAEVKRPMRCSASPCKVAAERGGDTEIRKGDRYFTWARKFGRSGVVYFRHVECGRPRMSELSSRKTVLIDEAVSDAVWDFSPQVDEDGSYDGDVSDLTSTLEEIASVAREVGEEYQDSFDNMPENLQQGETGQALEQVAQELDSWADELESWEPQAEYEQPERPDESDFTDGEDNFDEDAYKKAMEDWHSQCQDELDIWASDVLQEAQDACSDHPEYEG